MKLMILLRAILMLVLNSLVKIVPKTMMSKNPALLKLMNTEISLLSSLKN